MRPYQCQVERSNSGCISTVIELSYDHDDMIHGAVSGVVGNFVGITLAVRQRILPDKQLLEVGQCIPVVLL